MKKSFVLGTLALAMMSATVFAKDIATVNGKGIPSERSDAIIKSYVAQGAKESDDMRKGVREDLIMDEVLVQEAEKQGLANANDFKEQLEIGRRTLLKQSLIKEYFKKNPVEDKEVKAQYDQIMAARKGKEYHVKQIVVKKDTEAKDIISQLNKGGNFEKLAASKSIDKTSGANGGDIGWVPEKTGLGGIVSKLKKGETTQVPVNGAVVILKMVDSRNFVPPKYEQIKPSLKHEIEQAKFAQYARSLREKAKVE